MLSFYLLLPLNILVSYANQHPPLRCQQYLQKTLHRSTYFLHQLLSLYMLKLFSPILCFQSSSLQGDLWHFHWSFSGLFILSQALRFSASFLPIGVFTLHSFPYFSAFCDSDASTSHTGFFCSHRVSPSG